MERWFPQILVVALATLLAHAIALFMLRKAATVASHTASPWDDALIQALRKPLSLAIWLTGFSLAATRH